MKPLTVFLAALTLASTLPAVAASPDSRNVRVTPLGGIDGEFCPQDRALVFEDPNGTRILYDPGRTVAGAGDPRLGKIDIILVSHMHGDHVGNAHNKAPNSGSCEKPDVSVSDVPNTNAVNIALAKQSKIVTGSEMPPFFAAKLKANGGDPANAVLARFGGSVVIGGVRIATVAALHSNGLDPDLIGGDLGKQMKDAGIAGDVGPATGYVLTFSNGLVAYLSGDTGVLADQEFVVRDLYHAKLVVMNMGDGFTTGPREAAYIVNSLVKPASVIPSHANEVGTVNGKIRPGSKTEAFVKAVHVPVHVPLSGRTMAFDAKGLCVAGCK
ncbi:MBL fold metallo-hydrolase [Achromobacter aloeverae]|uniref:Metal-dependent hydrolase n=1 Tax=Achromobacter aloeverae TaxID=1750518 RepID=A0A4Q1HGU0_9BURK|nr:MBL fold metallo-hydrolase [Achromobacter aloeverae]RXN85357.1 metal-dependent hydrolase [Achromobacter aloeverae]